MKSVKPEILRIIYDSFDQWAANEKWACKKGCATCCTQNVTITGLEGEHILDYIDREGRQQWLVEKLEAMSTPHRPNLTINQFASACLTGKEHEEEPAPAYAVCPFLENNECAIYPARPFSCRCFLSLHRCSPNRSAVVFDSYIAASMSMNQLIEHLGQREYWGNMLDVLPSLLDMSKYRRIAEKMTKKNLIITARGGLLSGRPLPGFLIGADEYEKVEPLLTEIFSAKVEGKTVEDILNGH